jgi:hypothetical protein
MGILGDLVSFYGIWGSWKDDQLTEPEKELLILADAEEGFLYVISTNETGEFVQIGRKSFLDDKEPAVRARALEALEKLFRRGLIRHEGDSLFCLTGTGFDKAREIKGRS